MSASAIERARLLLATVLGLAVEAIGDDAGVTTVPAWDSLAHVRIVLRLEEDLGRALAPDEVLAMRDLNGIASILQTDAEA